MKGNKALEKYLINTQCSNCGSELTEQEIEHYVKQGFDKYDDWYCFECMSMDSNGDWDYNESLEYEE